MNIIRKPIKIFGDHASGFYKKENDRIYVKFQYSKSSIYRARFTVYLDLLGLIPFPEFLQ